MHSMKMAQNEKSNKTVLELDLASYTDIARSLEENLDVYAVKAFEDQVQSFVDHGLTHVDLKRDEVVLGSAGDNAILVFEESGVMHRFAEAVQQAVATHNLSKTIDSAKRWFRMGAATGSILVIPEERRIVGTTVARAVRLEAAACNGQLLVDVATYNSLPESLRGAYGQEEVICGKRDERFAARRCTFVQPEMRSAKAPSQISSDDGKGIAGDNSGYKTQPVHASSQVFAEAGYLVRIVGGPESGRTILLDSHRVTIGRAPTSDVQLRDPYVSRTHCALEWDGVKKGYKLIPLGSATMLAVNKRLVNKPIHLREGDEIKIGSTTMIVEHSKSS